MLTLRETDRNVRKEEHGTITFIEFIVEKGAVIKGDGSSLWGDSDVKRTITRGEVETIVWSDGGECSRLWLYDAEWTDYTDTQIEKQVEELFKQPLETLLGRKITAIGWSEQGMQPDGGWNFDVVLAEEKQACPGL